MQAGFRRSIVRRFPPASAAFWTTRGLCRNLDAALGRSCARKRTEVVDRLCERLRQHGWNIPRRQRAAPRRFDLHPRGFDGFRALPHPRPGRPKKLIQASTDSGISKASRSTKAVNTTTGPSTFPPPSAPSTLLETRTLALRLRRHLLPPASNPKASPTISSSPKSSATSSWDRTPPSRSNRVIRLFMFENPDPFLLA
jgi:hypothetical protein